MSKTKQKNIASPWPGRAAILWAAISNAVHCGWQALGCLHFDANDARRQAWNGKWPGEDDCERLDFFVNGDPDFPDLNPLFTDCVWDADTGPLEGGRQ